MRTSVAAISIVWLTHCIAHAEPSSSWMEQTNRTAQVATPQSEQDLAARVAALEKTLKEVLASLEQARQREESLVSLVTKLQELLKDLEAAPTSKPRVDDEPPAKSPVEPFEFRYLSVELRSFELARGGIRATLLFRNTSPTQYLAVAHRAQHSDGIADFWKFMPQPIGLVTDNAGMSYKLASDCRLGCARHKDDLSIIAPGETSTATFEFQAWETGLGTIFSLSMDLRVYMQGVGGSQGVSNVSITFSNIRPMSGR